MVAPGIIPFIFLVPLIGWSLRLTAEEDAVFIPDETKLSAVDATFNYDAPDVSDLHSVHMYVYYAQVYCTMMKQNIGGRT